MYSKITFFHIYLYWQVLSHSWEWVQRNDGLGLANLKEKANEAVQGVARNIRKHNCFQGNILHNLTQCLQHLQLQSDMLLNREFIATTKNVSHSELRYLTTLIDIPNFKPSYKDALY